MGIKPGTPDPHKYRSYLEQLQTRETYFSIVSQDTR